MTLYDPRRPEVVANPYPVLRGLRVEDPVHSSEILGGWVLTRYADVRLALGPPALRGSGHTVPRAPGRDRERDPDQFTEPERLDVRRADNRHLAFGHGVHFCLGAPLARLEGQIALPALLARFPSLSLRDDAPKWLDSLVFRGNAILARCARVTGRG